MTLLLGRWAVRMRTPVGTIDAVMTFFATDGGIAGSAAGKAETVHLHNICIVTDSNSDHVTWSQVITKPLRLNLDFDVLVTGDGMRGHSRAGRLPTSAVTGHRLSSS